MLTLERALEIDGTLVFRDHADPNQFWYLPGPVSLARRGGGNEPALSFIKFKQMPSAGEAKGGGFAMLETTLLLSEARRNRMVGALAAEPGVTTPVLASVPFETGTVQCIALNLQGAGGTTARAAPVGAFNAVEEILGATTPSLDAQNRAAFSLVLSKEGATILDQAFSDGLAPIGVIYSLTYSAMRPALEVEITADYKRIYQQFSASLEGQYMFVRAGIDAAFEKLVQTGAIKVKVVNFTGEDDEKEKEKWALDLFKNDLMADWFEPTLTPGTILGQAADADPLSEVLGFGRSMLDGTGQPGQPSAAPGPATPLAPGQSGTRATPPQPGGGAGPTTPTRPAGPTTAASPARPATPTSGTASPTTPGSTTTATSPRPGAPPGSTTTAPSPRPGTPPGSATAAPSPRAAIPLGSTTTAPSPRPGTPPGSTTAVPSPRPGIPLGSTTTSPSAQPGTPPGSTTTAPSAQPGTPPGSTTAAPSPRPGIPLGSTTTAPSPRPGTPVGGPAQPGAQPTPTTSTPPTGATAAQPTTTSVAASLKLKFVRQEELKTLTLRYNRAEAVKRIYAPQGFVGLMLSEIDDPARFKTEVDLDDPFFRSFEIVAEAPGDFARTGLITAEAAIDYGDEQDEVGVKHVDFVFRPGDQGPKRHSFTLSEKRDLQYSITRQFHFDPGSGWDAPDLSYEIPRTRTADRTLLLSPSDLLDFLEIGIEPGDIDAGIVERIEARLDMKGPGDFAREATFTISPGGAKQQWRVRCPRAPNRDDPRRLSYSLKHHLKDGTVREEGPFETTAGRILVHDPFPTALEITLIPLFGDEVAESFAEIEYDDDANNYHRRERLSVKGDATVPIQVRIALLNPEHRVFRCRFTFVGKDRSFSSGQMFEPAQAIVPWRP